jgi:hypothetical protein
VSVGSGSAPTALDTAIIIAPEARDPALLKKLDTVAGGMLNR